MIYLAPSMASSGSVSSPRKKRSAVCKGSPSRCDMIIFASGSNPFLRANSALDERFFLNGR